MKANPTEILHIAILCHEVNRAHCANNNDASQRPWAEAEEWQRESAIKGVEFALANPDAGDDAQHNAWMADKLADGWVYGETKDATAKTHPCLVPFDHLPPHQQAKDRLFCAIVRAMAPGGEPETPVAQTKRWRRSLDGVLQEMKAAGEPEDGYDLFRSRETAVTRLIESVMWCGMILKNIGTPNPYPESYNPDSPVVEPTSDNLKL